RTTRSSSRSPHTSACSTADFTRRFRMSVAYKLPQEDLDAEIFARRWDKIERPYSKEAVEKLRGSIKIEYTLANLGARRLWPVLNPDRYGHALGGMTGNQAMQMVRAGLKAIYCSGWQVAADANVSGNMYPDQSLYPVNSVPAVVKRLNQALERAD